MWFVLLWGILDVQKVPYDTYPYGYFMLFLPESRSFARRIPILAGDVKSQEFQDSKSEYMGTLW